MFLVCDSSPCLNDGTCVNSGSGFACQCPTRGLITSTGDRCETVVCNATTECNDKGICAPPQSGSTTRCNCRSPFTGPNCEDRINACITFGGNDICNAANETCINRAGLHFECGNPCNVSGVLCHNGGTCSPRKSAVGFTCACPEGYTGAVCDILMPTTPTATASKPPANATTPAVTSKAPTATTPAMNVTSKAPTAAATTSPANSTSQAITVTSKAPIATPAANATTPAVNVTSKAPTVAATTSSEPPVNATSLAEGGVTPRISTNITAAPTNATIVTPGPVSKTNDLDDWIIAVIIVVCVVVIVLLILLFMCLCRQQSSSYSPKAMEGKSGPLGLYELPRADPLIF